MPNSEEIPEICRTFSARFKSLHGVMCFLLDYIPDESSAGLELSSLRRAGLFQRYLDCDVILLTNQYQSRGTEYAAHQISLGRMVRARVLNLFDYLQGIDRSVATPRDHQTLPWINPAWAVRPDEGYPAFRALDAQGNCRMYVRRFPDNDGFDYVNYLSHGHITRRDTYDPQGFLSRTELLEPQTGFSRQQIYYRPDHTIALTVTCRKEDADGKKSAVEAIELMDPAGHVFQRFFSHEELVAFWLLALLRDPSCFYILLSELASHYMRAFQEFRSRRRDYPNIRIICQPHNVHVTDPLEPLHSKLGNNYRYLGDRSMRVDAAVPLTQWQKDDILERFGTAAPPIVEVIPHAFTRLTALAEDSSVTQQPADHDTAPASPPAPSIILVGRLNPQKQQDLALIALKKILQSIPDAVLHFYGVGPDEQKLRKLVEEQGLTEQVVFHGFVSDMAEVYRSASLLIMTSRTEGFPLVLQEALSLGVPAVCFDCRYGPSAMIENNSNGYLVKPGDTDSLSERCVEILKDAELRKRLSSGAVKSMERFTPPVIAAKWAGLCLKLLPPL